MDKNLIIYACREHVEMAIDDYINDKNDETSPNMEKCSEGKCNYCNEKSEYKISE